MVGSRHARTGTTAAGLLVGALALAGCSSSPHGSSAGRSTTTSAGSADTTTAPSTPQGYTLAKQAWQNGASADSADQAMYWNQAATDLMNAESAVGASSGTYAAAVSELQQLVSIPETSDTPTQMSEAENDTTALNTFFGTPGLYG